MENENSSRDSTILALLITLLVLAAGPVGYLYFALDRSKRECQEQTHRLEAYRLFAVV